MARVAPIIVPAAVALAVLAGVVGCGGGAERPGGPISAGGGALAASDGAAPAPAAPPALPGPWAIAQVTRREALRATPGGPRVASVGPLTEFGGPRVMSVLRRRGDWLEVVVPERPNAHTGWIRATAAQIG